MLSKEKQEKAKKLAKLAIAFEFEQNKEGLEKINKLKQELNEFNAGVFVTLKLKGELRGCIGFPNSKPLGNAIVEAARLAAFYDPRFMPLSKDESKDIDIEITLLSEPQEIKVKEASKLINEIEIGKHGLIIASKERNGLLLPQVAIEHSFDALSFIEATCIKAGLSKDAWQNNDVRIFKFEGIWF